MASLQRNLRAMCNMTWESYDIQIVLRRKQPTSYTCMTQFNCSDSINYEALFNRCSFRQYILEPTLCSQNNAVNIRSRTWAERPRICASIPCRSTRFSYAWSQASVAVELNCSVFWVVTQRDDPEGRRKNSGLRDFLVFHNSMSALWSILPPASPALKWPRSKNGCLHQLAPRLRISGVIPPLLHTSHACVGTTLPLRSSGIFLYLSLWRQ